MKYLLLILMVLSLQTLSQARDYVASNDFYSKISALFDSEFHGKSNKKKDEAFHFLAKHLKDDPRANYYFGLLLEFGLGFKQNNQDALIAYEKSIKLCYEQNNMTDVVLPLHNAGILMTEDENDTKIYAKGMKYLRMASDLNYNRSTYAIISRLSRNVGNLTKFEIRKKIIVLYQKLLEDDKYRSRALIALGSMYSAPHSESKKVIIDYDKARKYWLEAANKYKKKIAYNFLSYLYDRNDTGFQNKETSSYWRMKYYTDAMSIEPKEPEDLVDTLYRSLPSSSTRVQTQDLSLKVKQ